MADHVREQILDAVVTRLTGLVTTGANVYRGRVYPLTESNLPGILIYQGADDPNSLEQNLSFIDSELNVYVEAVAQSASTQIDQILNQIDKEIFIALATDFRQGVNACFSTLIGAADEPRLEGEGAKPIGFLRRNYKFRYRTSRADPSA